MNAAEIETIKTEALAMVAKAANEQDLEAVRIKYLSRKGLLPQIMKSLKDVEPQERAAVGQGANALKKALSNAIEESLTALKAGSAKSN